MEILPVPLPIIRAGDDIASFISQKATIRDGDILVVSSKFIATAEGTAIDLTSLTPSDEAKRWAAKCGRDPAFREAILRETERMHGNVVDSSCKYAMLTELKPDGLTEGTILVANAGLDLSNAPAGFTIGWPVDPIASVRKLRSALQKTTQSRIAIILTDSCCRPRRLGVTAYALVCAGLDPLISQVGQEDLFGRPLTMTHEAVADQLATAGNFIMGNAGQGIPVAIIHDHGLPLSDFVGWVPGIDRSEDLFAGAL